MNWGDKRYHSLNYFLREKFKSKVYKISLDAGFSCPNRDGSISNGGCIFCSERGSGDYAGDSRLSIHEQFDSIKRMMEKKWKEGKYIAYFQAYTNTYAPLDVLRQKYTEAVNEEDVVALAIATRPDCLQDDVLDLLEELSKKVYVWVELGLQTSNEETAVRINRGYTMDVFEDALSRLRSRGIDTVCHVIFGLPGETTGDMMETVRYLAGKDIQGVKLHLLHLMKDTPMVELYEQGQLEFMEQDEYIDLVCRAISVLPPQVVIHRLTGDSPRALLIGPMWSLKKWEILNSIDSRMKEHDLYQGKFYKISDLEIAKD
jgi:radical SAM protein (TIGR01212 family)